MPNKICYGEKHIENKLSDIGAKVVKATENSFNAKKLCEESNQLLMDAQTEIADLYESLGDVLAAPAKRKRAIKMPNPAPPSSPED